MQKLLQDLSQVDIKKKTDLAVPFTETDENAHPGVEKYLGKVLKKNDQEFQKFLKKSK